MSISLASAADRRCVLGLVLALCLVLGFPVRAQADDATPEQARLAAALRQLDAIDRLIAPEIAQPRDERSRYHFDYTRLAADLERVRTGIRDYLSPPRAQPRDPAVLLGDYRRSSTPSVTATEASP
ncbi:integrative conjugative element protein, RAQPRD family [Pseudomonas sp. Hp2]|uniref:integrative conjugative element protein, RAQPRD family n=1 Tax=Pseudomonas sp. Hp2 TaxID=701189 RepID=UPI00112A9F04|nr:RAQPRD family integrative conjugative element protein [Pseudomonas sp. Hp2]